MRRITIALVGQPNVGKSMLANAMGDTHLRVGNFGGVTVEKIEVTFKHGDYEFVMVDLPGSYSLNDYTQEESITKGFLIDGKYDLILNVADSTNLERNLYLTSELLELDKKIVIALNMIDEAEKEGTTINAPQLKTILGPEVVKVSAAKKTGIDELLTAIIATHEKELEHSKLRFSPFTEREINRIVSFFKKKKHTCDIGLHSLAIKLLQGDKETYKELHDKPIFTELQALLTSAFDNIYTNAASNDLEEIFADERVAFAKGAVTETVRRPAESKETLTEKIDKILIHPLLGLPIFLLLMWGLFQLTFSLGSIPMGWIEQLFALLATGVKNFLGDNNLSRVITDGALPGVGAVVMFLPNIMILFFGIALLETTGYMSRVAFLLDGFFHKFGLHGKSFIPLVTGFGCTVPAYMAARTVKNEKDRILTLFVLGFVSCSARLPIYVLFIGAFFPTRNAGNMLFLIYVSGALFALLAAKLLKMTAFKGSNEPFVMEMPKYRLPTFQLLWRMVYTQALSYLRKAGTFILAASIIIWFASNYPKSETKDDSLAIENSYLGQIGKITQPFFAPLGFDWKMSVAIEAGLAAKEVVVSTMAVLHGFDSGHKGDKKLLKTLRKQIPLPSAVAFIVFVMLYLPCFAASAVFAREAGGWKYLVYLFLFTTTVAWIAAFIARFATIAIT